jgi:hypothetical protein
LSKRFEEKFSVKNFISSQMKYPQQQNMSFPDTIAVCLDEDKSVVNKKLIDFNLIIYCYLI